MQTRGLAVGLLVTTLILACGSTPEEQPAKAHEQVINGTLSGPAEDYVVRVASKTTVGVVYCSGALIAPNLVATSRQCLVDAIIAVPYACDTNGSFVGAGIDTSNLVAPASISIQAGTGPNPPEVAKGGRIFSASAATLCVNDFAVVQLDRALTNLPILPLRLYGGVVAGEWIRVIGYGLTSTDLGTPVGIRYGRSELHVAKVGSNQFLPDGGGTAPSTFTITGSVMCPGDGGGPALSANGALVGTLSSITGDCSSSFAVSTFTQVSSYANEVILPAFAAAGYEPTLEINPSRADAGAAGTGGAGTGGADTGGVGNALDATGGGAMGGASAVESIPLATTPSNPAAKTSGGCSVSRSRISHSWLALLCTVLVVRRWRANVRSAKVAGSSGRRP